MKTKHIHDAYLINASDISDISLFDEAQDRKIEQEVHEESSRSGVSMCAADDDIFLSVDVGTVAFLKTLYDLENGKKSHHDITIMILTSITKPGLQPGFRRKSDRCKSQINLRRSEYILTVNNDISPYRPSDLEPS